MPKSTERPAANQPKPEKQSEKHEKQSDKAPIDSRDLVYRGGYDGDPREILENPAVTPELVEQAPEDIRDDLMPKNKDE
jgi:hypothetical protein